VRILFPMISNCKELAQAKTMLAEAAESLEKDGKAYKGDIEVGVMIEVPSAVIMADQLARMCDFFSIGTNDLIQYTLAIDRGNRNVAYLYDPLDPAILRMIKHVADAARKAGIRIAMCGEMAGEPIHLPILIGLGITELSMNTHAIPVVKRMVRRLSAREARQFAAEIVDLHDAEEINRRAEERYGVILQNGQIPNTN
jgi:phosphotransferase system enzyme I (PtsI)